MPRKVKDKIDQDHFARFDDAMRKLLSVPKSEIDKRLAEEKKAREKEKKAG